jgi:hypothetical protein
MVNRARFRMRIGFVRLPHVAALICFSKTPKTRTRSISRLRRSTIRLRLRHRKRSSSKINCRGLRSTNRSRPFRQSQRKANHGLHGWIRISDEELYPPLKFVNGADGSSDIEGKVARVSGEGDGKRSSFKFVIRSRTINLTKYGSSVLSPAR